MPHMPQNTGTLQLASTRPKPPPYRPKAANFDGKVTIE